MATLFIIHLSVILVNYIFRQTYYYTYCRTMLCINAACAIVRWLAVYLSCMKTAKLILKLLHLQYLILFWKQSKIWP